MNGYAGHTLKMVTESGKWNYVQIHMKSDQGCENWPAEEAAKLDGSNPDSSGQDLYEAIEKGEFPSWTVRVQVMSPEEAQKAKFSVLDLTKVWSQKDYPLRTIGKFTLDRNPENYHNEVEQAAFAPSHLVSGIEPSNDPVLQARLFSYPDAHRYRLGANYNGLPINCPVAPVSNFARDGFSFDANGGSAPNYPSSLQPLKYTKRPYTLEQISDAFDGNAPVEFKSGVDDDVDFEQPRILWQKVFNDDAKKHFVENVSGHLGGVQYPHIIRRQLAVFAKVDQDLAKRVEDALRADGVKIDDA